MSVLKPKPVESNQPVFDEPWQAEVLAMADLLIQSGHISAQDWASTFGQQLAIQQAPDDTLDNYYQAALTALTQLTQDRQIISQQQLQGREMDWKDAYLRTPHGESVNLLRS